MAPAPQINWDVPPRTWGAALLRQALQTDDAEFESMVTFTKAWFELQNPEFLLKKKDTQTAAKAWATATLRPHFSDFFSRIPQDTAWSNEAPYGFMKFVSERYRTQSRRALPKVGEDTPKQDSRPSSAPKQCSRPSSASALSFNSGTLLPSVSTAGIPKPFFLTFIRGETSTSDDQCFEYISIDELALKAPDCAFTQLIIIARYVSISRLRDILEQRGLDRDSLIFSLVSGNRTRPIDSDMELREKVRWSLNTGNSQFGIFSASSIVTDAMLAALVVPEQGRYTPATPTHRHPATASPHVDQSVRTTIEDLATAQTPKRATPQPTESPVLGKRRKEGEIGEQVKRRRAARNLTLNESEDDDGSRQQEHYYPSPEL
ncbi:hypothetical protein MMC28_001647 [Mycoblastus sanguinarius]|nr:hypothetical protein [Mycoblastus sanguinarius]